MTTTADTKRELMLIGGEWMGSEDGRFLQVKNPARREAVIAEVPRAGAADVDRAVRAAATAFEDWKVMMPRERGKLLLKIADALDAQAE